MRIVMISTMLALLFALVGCSSAPRPMGYPYSAEQNMQAVHHWELLAQEVVRTQVLPITPKNQPVYVDNSDRTEFGKAFHNYIFTDLIAHDIQPVSSRHGATTIKWGTQLVWNEKRGPIFPGVVLGALEFVGFVVAGGPASAGSRLEVILTAQVENENQILSRRTHNFYINEYNKLNFRQPVASLR